MLHGVVIMIEILNMQLFLVCPYAELISYKLTCTTHRHTHWQTDKRTHASTHTRVHACTQDTSNDTYNDKLTNKHARKKAYPTQKKLAGRSLWHLAPACSDPNVINRQLTKCWWCRRVCRLNYWWEAERGLRGSSWWPRGRVRGLGKHVG